MGRLRVPEAVELAGLDIAETEAVARDNSAVLEAERAAAQNL
jgi:hypothetical protein